MKGYILLIALLVSCLSAKASEVVNQLVVWTKNDAKMTYWLSDCPKMSFTETYMIVEHDGTKVNVAIEDIIKLTYEKAETTAIDNFTKDSDFIFDGTSITLSGLYVGTDVHVYTIDGALVLKGRVEDGGCTVDVSTFPTGIYIVKTSGATYKIIRE